MKTGGAKATENGMQPFKERRNQLVQNGGGNHMSGSLTYRQGGADLKPQGANTVAGSEPAPVLGGGFSFGNPPK